eukprot:1148553-Pelagomonas_calceolata.AAC.3
MKAERLEFHTFNSKQSEAQSAGQLWKAMYSSLLLSPGAQHNSLSSRFTGISICHLIYDDKAMTQVLRHAIYSAILNTEAFSLMHAAKGQA